MAKRIDGPGAVSELWHRVADGISNSFWTHKGLSGSCPFCGAESDSSKLRFLAHFSDSTFKGFNCFVCGQSGSGLSGAQKLIRATGIQASVIQVGDAVGNSTGDLWAPKDDVVTAKEWPASWIEETDEVYESGMTYLNQRGVLNATERVERHEIRFSESVLMELQSGPYLRPYPCVVAPMHNARGEVVGFTSRRIGKVPDGEQKTIDQTGIQWKKEAVFGLPAINPRRPVTIVEGLFSALSTPNSIACGGKKIHPAQIKAIASTGARVFVFALDPDVDKKFYADAMYRLSMEVPSAIITRIDWTTAGGLLERDPNDRGEHEMAELIRAAVLDAIRKQES